MKDSTQTTDSAQIITVTPAAVKEVKRLMVLEKADSLYLRLGVQAGGCSGMSYSMDFDSEKSEFDREFEFDGLQVLVDLKAVRHLAGTVLEYKGGMLGGGFNFHNPNAKRSCGCGSSFSC
jgi:iron-sulfur cluster assembly protein